MKKVCLILTVCCFSIFISCENINTGIYVPDNEFDDDCDNIETNDDEKDDLSLVWTKFAGSESVELVFSATVDTSGSIYVVGSTQGSLEGNVLSGSEDAFLMKFSSDGNTEWIRQWGTTEIDNARAVTVDIDDNIVVAGKMASEIEGEITYGYWDGFVSKFSSNGEIVWTESFGLEAYEVSPRAIVSDEFGNIFISGIVFGTFENNKSFGNYDVFAAKFTRDGALSWVKQWGTDQSDSGIMAIDLDGDGNLFIAGSTEGVVGEGENNGGVDIFLTKMNKNGKIAWTQQFGTTLHDSVTNMRIDNNGNIYITGFTLKTADNGNLEEENLLLKFNKNGILEWQKLWGNGFAFSVEILGDSEILVGGAGTGYEDSELSQGTVTTGMAYLAKFNENGKKLFTKQFGGTDSYVISVMEDKKGDIISAGHSCESFDDVLANQIDVFITKWNRD